MTTDRNLLNAPQSSTSGGQSLQTSNDKLKPAPVTEMVAMLTTCLTLVKPVGMSSEDAHSWLTVACNELAYLPVDILESGCSVARRTCTHHGQIVPAIIKETEGWMAMRRNLARANKPVEKPVALLEVETPTDGDFADLLANLKEINRKKTLDRYS